MVTEPIPSQACSVFLYLWAPCQQREETALECCAEWKRQESTVWLGIPRHVAGRVEERPGLLNRVFFGVWGIWWKNLSSKQMGGKSQGMSRDQPGVLTCLSEISAWDEVALSHGCTSLFCFMPLFVVVFFPLRKYITNLRTEIVIFNCSV